MKKSIVIILFSCLIPLRIIMAAPHIVLDEAVKVVALGSHLDILEDTQGLWTIDDVVGRLANQFEPSTMEVPNFGFTSSAIWLRIRIQNPEQNGPADQLTSPTSKILEIAYPHLDEIELYISNTQGNTKIANSDLAMPWIVKTSGDLLPFESREIQYRLFAFEIDFYSDEEKTLFLRVRSQSSMQLPINLLSPAAFSEKLSKEQIILGGYYGMLLVMVFYNLFIYFSVRDRSYLYYVFYVSVFLLFQMTLSGWSFQYLWPRSPGWANLSLPLLIFGCVITGVLFSRSFLQTYNNIPKTDMFLRFCVTVSSFGIIYSFFYDYATAIKISVAVTGITVIPLACIGVYSWYKKVKTAKFFVLAWVSVLTGSFIFILKTVGFFPKTILTDYSMHVGSLIEVIFLSFGLADRIKQEREERYLAQKDKEAAETATKAKTQFFASMSHEFRTPLTAILGYTEIAARPDLSEQQRLDHIKTIETSAQHMLQLINDILDLSKFESQKMDVEKIPVDLVQIIDQVNDFIYILAKQKGIRFDICYQYPLPKHFISDPTRLKQALINLCSNSVKFTQQGGVTLSIACDRRAEQLHFAVSDTGIGLKEIEIKKLFTAFEQADSSTSRHFGGTGIGLYLSRLIANLLGGDIHVESQFGKGSTFTLSISAGGMKKTVWLNGDDVQASATTQANKGLAIERDKLSNGKHLLTTPTEPAVIKVLLAEDNVVNQKLISFHLKQFGTEVCIANDGVEALGEVHRQNFDLILMDMNMPYLSGLDVVKLLREKGSKQKIYALTGNVDEEAIRECNNAGCDGHLTKPLELEKLRTVVESIRADGANSLSATVSLKASVEDDTRLHNK